MKNCKIIAILISCAILVICVVVLKNNYLNKNLKTKETVDATDTNIIQSNDIQESMSIIESESEKEIEEDNIADKSDSESEVLEKQVQEKDDEQNVYKNVNKDKNIVYDVGSYGDQIETYDSIEKLATQSEHIIRGKVVGVSSDFHEIGTIYTRYDVMIDEVYVGGKKSGDVITISMPGGIVPLKEYAQEAESFSIKEWENVTKEDLETGYIQSISDDEPLPEIGEECIYFLKKITQYEPDKIYMTLGNYQGRFFIENSAISRNLPKNQEDAITVKNLDEFVGILAELVK